MDCAPRADISSQSLLLRGDRVWSNRNCIACRIPRYVNNAPLATFVKDTRRGETYQRQLWIDEWRPCAHYTASREGNRTHYCVSHKASHNEHVLCCKEGEEGCNIFRLRPLLCLLLRIDVLQGSRWVRATALFVFVLFALGSRAAFASQTQPARGPVVDCTCSLISLDVEARISPVVDEDGAKVVNLLSNGDQEFGKASEAQATDSIQCTNPRRNLQDDQGCMLRDHSIVAYNEYNDGSYEESADTFLEGGRMQHAYTFSPELQQTTVNKSSGANGAIKEQQEISVEDKVLENAIQELSSAPGKLTVPLRVVSLRGSVPSIWLKDFIRSQGKRVKVKFEFQGDLEEITSALDAALKKKQVTPRSILAADVVTLGDSWLHTAVSGHLIQPIENAEQYEWFNRLSPRWQAFLRRDEDGHLHTKGLIWGAPYRWGSMVIAFRTDKLARNSIPGIEDWKDLWRPELRGKIAMVDSSREVVGAVLKSLGAFYNTQDFDTDVEGGRSAVKQQFYALRKQVKVFDSVYYLKALQSDDVWVAVGWSNDVIPVAKRMSNVRVIAPKSGSSLWADLWAIPATSSVPSNKIGSRVCGASPLVYQWLDFCLQPARQEPFKQGTSVGASPLSSPAMEGVSLATNSRSSGPSMDTNMIDGMPPADSLEKSEVLEPLSDKALADYRWLFLQAETSQGFSEKVLEVIKQLLGRGIKQR